MNETKPVEGTHGCRAPVNGLVIGATVGAVLALVFLLPYFGSGADGRIYLVAPGIAAIYAVGGLAHRAMGKKALCMREPQDSREEG